MRIIKPDPLRKGTILRIAYHVKCTCKFNTMLYLVSNAHIIVGNTGRGYGLGTIVLAALLCVNIMYAVPVGIQTCGLVCMLIVNSDLVV